MPKIKDLPVFERPREKLLNYGSTDKLEDYELLAILLRTGVKNLNAIALAKKILQKYKEQGITGITIEELQKNFGMGPVKACEIVACFELGKRLLQGKQTKLILTPEDIWNEMRDIRGSKREHFVVFYLDTRNQIIKRKIVSIGILNSSIVHPREVFEIAIKNSSASIAIAHNHPSGVATPSEDDLVITRRLVEAGKILGIEIVDHVIVTPKTFYSYKKEGKLD